MLLSFPLVFLIIFPGDLKELISDIGRLLALGERKVVWGFFLRQGVLKTVWVWILGLSFSTLLKFLMSDSLRFGVLVGISSTFEEEGMESMSTSRLVLFWRKELVPKIISELVQSKNGLISWSSYFSSSFCCFLWIFTHFSNHTFPESNCRVISDKVESIRSKASCLHLLSY